MKATKEEIQRRLELYNQGMTDKEISGITGTKIDTIRYWRSKNNLPCNVKMSEKLNLYLQNFNVREIAERLSMDSGSILYWRKSLGLSKVKKIKKLIDKRRI